MYLLTTVAIDSTTVVIQEPYTYRKNLLQDDVPLFTPSPLSTGDNWAKIGTKIPVTLMSLCFLII